MWPVVGGGDGGGGVGNCNVVAIVIDDDDYGDGNVLFMVSLIYRHLSVPPKKLIVWVNILMANFYR